MHARLLPLLIVLMAAVLLALGIPLAVSLAAGEQQKVVVDRIDDTARFAALAQFVTDRPAGCATLAESDERGATLQKELATYHEVYGINGGVFYRDECPMARAPGDWEVPEEGEGRAAFDEALAGRRSHDPQQVWPWQHSSLFVASPVIRDGDVVAVVVTDSPTGQMRSRILHGWVVLFAGEFAAMLLAVGAALRLAGWVLRPVRVLDATTHDIATGRLKSRVAAAADRPNSGAWPARSTRWPTTSRACWNSSAPSSPTPPTSSATPSRHSCCGSNCSPSNCPRATRRSPPCAPRASGSRMSSTTCWTWR